MDNETRDFLQSLADKLGASVEKVYGVLIKQAKIEAIKDVINLILLIISGIVLYTVFIHIYPYCKPKIPTSQYEFDREWPEWVQLSMIFTSLGILINFIFILIQVSTTVSSCVTAIMNPESYAIETLANFRK